jgi:hypothetical protein
MISPMRASSAALRGKLPAVAAVPVASAIVASQLFFPPVVGLANNGDFERVIYSGFLRAASSVASVGVSRCMTLTP